MKQKDIALIVFIVVVSAFISYFLSGILISSPKNRKESVEVVESIKADFPTVSQDPYSKFFNKDAINPTQTIKIGGDSNSKPFSGSGQ